MHYRRVYLWGFAVLTGWFVLILTIGQTFAVGPDSIFVADVTVPDDSVFRPDERFVKTWRIKNIGEDDWTMEYTLAFDEGDPLGAQPTQRLGRVVSPGDTGEISVTMEAPAQPGRYVSWWQMQDDHGNRFGQRFCARVIVQEIDSPGLEPESSQTYTDTSIVLDSVEARRLAALSVSCMEKDSEQALLLALASVALQDTMEGRSALAVAVGDYPRKIDLEGHSSFISDLAFSPNGEILASVAGDGVIVWPTDFRSPGVWLEDAEMKSDFLCLAFSPDGATLAVGDLASIYLWDVQAHLLLGVLKDDSEQNWIIHDVAFSPDGGRVASVSGGNVQVWSLCEHKPIANIRVEGADAFSVDFVQNEQTVAVGFESGLVIVCDLKTGREVRRYPSNRSVIDNIFSIGHGWIVSVDEMTAAITRFGPSYEDQVDSLLWVHPQRILDAAIDSGGELLATLDVNGDLDLIRVQRHPFYIGRTISTIRGRLPIYVDGLFREPVGAVAVHPDGHIVATTGCSDGKAECRGLVRVWDVAAGFTAACLDDGTSFTSSFKFSPDGRLIAVGGAKSVSLWDVMNGEKLYELEPKLPYGRYTVRFNTLAFNSTSTLLAACGLDTSLIWVWDLQSRDVVATLRGVEGASGLVFASDGDLLLSTYPRYASGYPPHHKPVLWDVRAGTISSVDLPSEIMLTLEREASDSREIARTVDGQWSASLTRDGDIEIWNAGDRQLFMRLAKQAPSVGFPVLSPAPVSYPALLPDRPVLLLATVGDRSHGGYAGLDVIDVEALRSLGCARITRPLTAEEKNTFDVPEKLGEVCPHASSQPVRAVTPLVTEEVASDRSSHLMCQ